MQLIALGKQDNYLTSNPEITFFKKVYRRYSHFSMELREIISEQESNYNNIISFKITGSDAVYRCYLEIELPLLSFDDSYITNNNYIDKKNLNLYNLNNLKLINMTKYNNLKQFVDIQMELYRKIYNLLYVNNITFSYIKDIIQQFSITNKIILDQSINKIDSYIYLDINIIDYLLNINKFLTTDTIFDSSIYVSNISIINQLDIMYNSMIYYLSYYNNIINEINNKIFNLTNTKINFNYSKYLGHVFFQYFNIEIGGQEIYRYSNDVLHINQLHHIQEEHIDNYFKMIGHTSNLYTFNTLPKGNTKIIVPLIFWFNKDSGSCLPLIGLQYSPVILNVKINDIKNIICFENYEQNFFDLTKITCPFLSENKININNNFIYKDYILNANKTITYNCLFINDKLLHYHFSDLSDNDIDYILINNGKFYSTTEIYNILQKNYNDQYLIDKFQWVKLMLNLNNPSYRYTYFYNKFASYYPYIDFNLYYSLIPPPKIKLICESIYFDDIERYNFANSKLEYIIETFEENLFTVNNLEYFDCELSFNNLCKELIWYIQPQILINKLSEFGQNTSLIFDSKHYFTNNIISDHDLIFNQESVLIKNINNNYYTYLLSYKYLNNILPEGIYYIPFCLYPEDTQPSGIINLKYFKGKQYYIKFNSLFIQEYNNLLNLLYNSTNIKLLQYFILKFISKNYEIIKIHKGQFTIL